MTQPGPNPQTNLIFSIVAPVVALIAVAVIYFTKPVISVPPPPAPVNVATSKLPADNVVQANALPGAGNGSGGSAMGGAPGGPGGPSMGMGSVPGGRPMGAGKKGMSGE